ncbi:TPA: hypothetical protein ACKPZ3_003097 [Serratia marcescens]
MRRNFRFFVACSMLSAKIGSSLIDGQGRMKKTLAVALAVMALTACKPGEEKALELAQKEISADLKDPDSAKFRYLRVAKTQENEDGTVLVLVCGQVNAKNGFGAYAGFHSFMIDMSMKEKGYFSKAVTYKVGSKKISTEDDARDIYGYTAMCGEDA